jgi:hypothetical protein
MKYRKRRGDTAGGLQIGGAKKHRLADAVSGV